MVKIPKCDSDPDSRYSGKQKRPPTRLGGSTGHRDIKLPGGTSDCTASAHPITVKATNKPVLVVLT